MGATPTRGNPEAAAPGVAVLWRVRFAWAGGALGNKGACVADLDVDGKRVAIVHAHLSSDLERADDRNREFRAIHDARLERTDDAPRSAAGASRHGRCYAMHTRCLLL